MKRIKEITKRFGLIISDHHNSKYISYTEALINFFKTWGNEYTIYDLNTVKKFKNSDTIFVLGNGPSLNYLNEKQIEIVNNNDSFGTTLSFLKKDIIPTFYHLSGENSKKYKSLIDLSVFLFQII